MTTPKFFIIAILAASLLAGCTKSADPSATSKVLLTMSAATTSGKATITGRVATTVSLTDVKVNVRDIKFNFEQEHKHGNDLDSADVENDNDDHQDQDDDNDSFGDDNKDEHDSSFVDNNNSKLVGPFIVDLLNAGTFVDQVITSVDLPNAKYEKVSFKLAASTEPGDMNGKSIFITGKIGDTPFIFWHHRDARFGARLADSATLITNGEAVNLAIHLELDKVLSAVNGGADLSIAKDGNQDGTITIDPANDDGNKHLADAIMRLLVRHTHCEKDHDSH